MTEFNKIYNIKNFFNSIKSFPYIDIIIKDHASEIFISQMTINNNDELFIKRNTNLNFSLSEKLNISFTYKNIYLAFNIKIINLNEKYYFFNYPKNIYYISNRMLSRIKLEDNNNSCIFIKKNNYKIIDVSTHGLSFLIFNKKYKINNIIKNVKVLISSDFIFYTNLKIRHIEKINNIYKYGASYHNIDWINYFKILNFIMQKAYPEFKFIYNYSLKEIIDYFKNTLYIHLENFNSYTDKIINFLKKISKTKNNVLINICIAYIKNKKLISIGNAIRLYNKTFIFEQLNVVNETILNPKIKIELYAVLIEILLAHPYSQYFLFYFSKDYQWYNEIFNLINKIIKNDKICFFDNWHCYEYQLNKKNINYDLDRSINVIAQNNNNEFVKFCKSELNELEIQSYNYDTTLNEIKQNYQVLNMKIERKIWKITKTNTVIGFAVAEIYPEDILFNHNQNICKIYFTKFNNDIVKQSIKVLIKEISVFYRLNKNKSFYFWIKPDNNFNLNIKIEELINHGIIGRVIMNKKGLSEFKNLLNSQFDYYTHYYPLSYHQKSIWYIYKLYSDISIWNAAGTIKIFENINIKLFEQAVNIFLKLNDTVRIQLKEEDNIPKQFIKKFKPINLNFFNFSNIKDINELYIWEQEKSKLPLKLLESPLFYFALIKINDTEYWFYAKIHHIITDHWSMSIMCKQILDNYYKLTNNIKINEKKHPSYFDYIINENNYKYTDDFEEDKEFWNKRFNELPELFNIKKIQNKHLNLKSNRKSFIIPNNIFKNIKKYCKQNQISEFVFFTSILFTYLYKISSKKNIVISTSISNRSRHYQKTFGLFINIIPFNYQVNENDSFNEQNKKLQDEWMSMVYHEKYPNELIVKEFHNKYNINENLNNITITYHNSKINDDDQFLKYKIRWQNYGHQAETLNIHINDRENNEEFIINYDYQTAVFSEDEIENMNKHINTILKDCITNFDKKIYELEILDKKEKNKLLYQFNNTEMNFPKNKSIHELFENQVIQTPNNIAVIDNYNKMTYKELNYKSNQIADYLLKNFTKEDKIIGILIPNNINQVIAILGILKAGKAFVPIDVQNPILRIKSILNNADIKILISENSQNKLLNNFKKQNDQLKSIIYLDDKIFLEDISILNKDNKNLIINSKSLCYIIFTSGSTGTPKGVMIKHRSLINLCYWYKSYFQIVKNDRATRYSSFSFDASIWELFPHLITGSSVYFINNEIIYNLEELNLFFEENKITISFLPTQVAEKFVKINNKSLRILQTAGDKLNYYLKSNYKFVNNYGPTEYTVCTTCFLIDKQYSNIPIGKPIANTKVYILDNSNQLVPLQVPGELHISGEGLALGYINNEKLTKEKFVNNPFLPNEKMYKTGDLAQWKNDGNIEFLGRIDNQIKIRGFRIELSDIEKNLLEYNDIKEVIVLANENKANNKFLCAYYISDIKININELNNFLSTKLPLYMMPKYFIRVDKFPLLPSGKINRAKLLQINYKYNSFNKTIKPKTNNEKKMADIWEKALEINNISINDNFFELGGDSLAIIHIISEANKFNWVLNIKDFYQYPTVKELSNKIESEKPKEVNIVKSEKNKVYIRKNFDDIHNIKLSGNKFDIKNILITGSTGYLGSHILDYLADKNIYNIYCLVRGENQKNAEERIHKTLNFYFPKKYNDFKTKNIFIINGDITEINFGLDQIAFKQLYSKTDTVLHSAAMVKFFGNYSDFKEININGTKKVIAFCKKSKSKLNYISTIGVSGNDFVEQKKPNMTFNENDYYVGQKYKDNPYILSKFIAEELIYKAIDKGLNASIFRVGNISERYTDGQFQINPKDNWFHLIINSLIKLNVISDKMFEIPIDLLPVDFCAKAIIELSKIIESTGKVYHIYNEDILKFNDFMPILNQQGIKFEILKNYSHNDFINYIKKNKNEKNNLLIPIINEFNYDKLFSEKYSLNINTDITLKYLKQLEIKWPEMKNEYLKKVVCNIINL